MAAKRNGERSIVYSDMRGVDFSLDGSSISKHRFAYLENMYRDYDGDGAGIVESIPGYRKIYSFGGTTNGLYSYKTKSGGRRIVVHADSTLYELNADDPDSVGTPLSYTGARDAKSSALAVADALFVFDGEHIFKFSEDGCEMLTEDSDDIYVPTSYYNGERYEQCNLLTRSFYEICNLGSCDAAAYGTAGLKYLIKNASEKTCELIGYEGSSHEIFVPHRVRIGDEYYYVKSIGRGAFRDNETITSCTIASGTSYIGMMAFNGCSKLRKVVLPDTVTEIGNAAFSGCMELSGFHLGAGVTRLGDGSFNTCPNLSQITYGGTAAEFASIINTDALNGITKVYEQNVRSATVAFEVHTPCDLIHSVTVNGSEHTFTTLLGDGGLCKTVVLSLDDKTLYHGKDVKIKGRLSSDPQKYVGRHQGFMASVFAGGTDVSSAIFSCTVAENFDGRVFLTGNPDYPGFCFYSSADLSGENNPLYFGEMNYFRDGNGSFGNTALLAAGDSLAVFKEDDDGSGSIYYHTPHDTGVDIIPRIYPVSYVHSGISAKGEVISFFDDPIFMSEKGVCALSKKQINLQRSIALRSSRVNPRLLRESVSEASLAVWRGYLAVLTDGRIYLADSRDVVQNAEGEAEYEWYYLSGIGSYTNDSRVYRYASVASEGYAVHENADGIAEGTVYSVSLGEKTVYYITTDGGTKYEVYPTDELRGGNFNPAKLLLAVGELLFAITGGGDLLLFNNDKRGVAPPHIKAEEDFDEREYAEIYGRRIHPFYYSFAGHAPRYALQTKRDDCSLPHLEKSTVKGSLTVKCRATASGKLKCEVGSDSVGYREVAVFPSSPISFGEVDFSTLSLITDDVYTVPIREHAKGWIEKQITLYTDEFCSPFGIYTIAYRFYVKGKIKRGR